MRENNRLRLTSRPCSQSMDAKGVYGIAPSNTGIPGVHNPFVWNRIFIIPPGLWINALSCPDVDPIIEIESWLLNCLSCSPDASLSCCACEKFSCLWVSASLVWLFNIRLRAWWMRRWEDTLLRVGLSTSKYVVKTSIPRILLRLPVDVAEALLSFPRRRHYKQAV